MVENPLQIIHGFLDALFDFLSVHFDCPFLASALVLEP